MTFDVVGHVYGDHVGEVDHVECQLFGGGSETESKELASSIII